MLKRFLVFEYEAYYPGGGWNDFEGSYDSIEDAKLAHPHADQIIDNTTGLVIYGYDSQGKLISFELD